MSLLHPTPTATMECTLDTVEVGHELPVRVTLGAHDQKARRAELRLVYRNTVRETKDSAVGDTPLSTPKKTTHEVLVAAVPVPLDAGPDPLDLRLAVPADAPPTTRKLVEWEVQLLITRHHGRNVTEHHPLVVRAPVGSMPELATGPAVSTVTWPMSLELSARMLRPGDVITGRLTFTPNESLRARRVRIDLRRLREDPAYNEQHTDAHVDVFEKGDLVAGRPETFTFSLPVPSEAEPTFVAEHNARHWYVDAVIDLPHAKDPRTSLEVVIASA